MFLHPVSLIYLWIAYLWIVNYSLTLPSPYLGVISMRKRGSSRTAELTVMMRALATHSRYASRVMNDPYAHFFLGSSILIPYLFNRLIMLFNPFFWRVGINSVGFLVALCRHRFMNDLILKSMDEKIRQIVMIGAGYDTSFIINSKQLKDTTIFEIDHPNTQSRKMRIIKKHSLHSNLNIAYIGADLEQDNIPNLLYEKGLDGREAVLVIAEGVVSYLSSPSIDRLFHSLFKLSRKVRFAADYRMPHMQERRVSRVVKRWRREFKMMKEPYRSFLNQQDMEQKLAEHGFKVREHHDMTLLWDEYSGDKAPEFLKAMAGVYVVEN